MACHPVWSATRSPPRRSKLIRLRVSFRSLGASSGGAVRRRKAAAIEKSIGYPPFGPSPLGAKEPRHPDVTPWLRRVYPFLALPWEARICRVLNSALSFICSYEQVIFTCISRVPGKFFS